MQNTYANECFIDELAAAASADPIEFRLKYLDPDRQARHRGAQPRRDAGEVGDAAVAAQGRRAATSSRGRGVSYVKYELVRTYVAVVAEVEVNRTTGADPGARGSTSPTTAGRSSTRTGCTNQLEGNVIQTVSRTLIEELKFDRAHGDEPRLGELSDPDASRTCRRSSST